MARESGNQPVNPGTDKFHFRFAIFIQGNSDKRSFQEIE